MKAAVPKSGQYIRPPGERVGVSQPLWSHAEFTGELDKAKSVGPAKLSDVDLLQFCRGAHNHFRTHFWADAGPFFVELWRRIEEKRVPNIPTKTEACRRIGCSLRWAELIVSGSARKANKRGASEAGRKAEAPSQIFESRTSQEYVAEITVYAERKLKPLLARGEWKRCRNIYSLLATHFADEGEVDHVDDLNGGNGPGESRKVA